MCRTQSQREKSESRKQLNPVNYTSHTSYVCLRSILTCFNFLKITRAIKTNKNKMLQWKSYQRSIPQCYNTCSEIHIHKGKRMGFGHKADKYLVTSVYSIRNFQIWRRSTECIRYTCTCMLAEINCTGYQLNNSKTDAYIYPSHRELS